MCLLDVLGLEAINEFADIASSSFNRIHNGAAVDGAVGTKEAEKVRDFLRDSVS